jgi:NADPH:quinone reductase
VRLVGEAASAAAAAGGTPLTWRPWRQVNACAPVSVTPKDRVIEVALGANLALDLALARAGTAVVTYAAEAADPALPVRACMSANVILTFVLLYGVPLAAREHAAADITAALAAGDLTGLPVHKFPLDAIAAAHEAAEAGAAGKVIVTP